MPPNSNRDIVARAIVVVVATMVLVGVGGNGLVSGGYHYCYTGLFNYRSEVVDTSWGRAGTRAKHNSKLWAKTIDYR